MLIFETQDDWYLTSLGWLKLPEHGQYQTWRARFKRDLSTYPYPYTSLIDQALLQNPFAEWGAERSFKNIDHPDQLLTTKGQQIHILATKGDWALVALTKRDGFYCSEAAIRGDIGWIRIITEQGTPLLSQVYSCC